MGEIVRLVLCELTMKGLLFNRQLSELLFEPQRFYTKYISEIERSLSPAYLLTYLLCHVTDRRYFGNRKVTVWEVANTTQQYRLV